MKIHNLTNTIVHGINHVSVPEGVEALYLYGSALSGRLRCDSDIDIALLSSHEIEPFCRLELISKVEALTASLIKPSGFEYPVSVLDLRGKYISFELQYTVITEGKLIFERDKVQRYEFENAVKRDYFDFIPYLRLLRKKKYGQLLQKV